ncbi:glycosyltransferase family 39 protein [Streptomyces sp. NBC_01381]|uniref:ArnT family glycosyltransferase n=1 Tax=Streptomyces sp. NBC_01381 TaxID=2903845 RepID=UPI002259CBAA|nr:glycosyltransferase family 39 protein [Streptomyces sp. NBC_01381]MCX4671871.1 glycosyltransferase family 39 protein [Streptomyces sp. NBC_01381]
MTLTAAATHPEASPGTAPPPHRRWFWRSPPDQPPWARPALLGVAALAAVLYGWNLTSSSYAPYYSVAARSMSESWHAFWFTALDPAATITMDKVGGFLWPQALAARLFGFHAWALTLPQVLEGVVSVLVLYRVVRRWQGPVAGLAAAGLLTMTPVAASMFGHAILDASLTMCLVLAADQYQKAVMTGRLGPLLLSGVWIGLGFQAKMMQAWVVVPALALGYLIAAPHPLRKRLGQLVTAGGVLLAVSLSWVALMTFTPESSRPYADGTTNNSAFAMVFGYNGLDRLHDGLIDGSFKGTFQGAPPSQGQAGAQAGDAQAMPGTEGWGKLFGPRFAAQIGWLYPLALLSLVLGLARHRRAPRTDQRRAGYLMWGGWLLTSAVLLSAMGVPHTAYVTLLAPALAALAAAGIVALWRIHRTALGPPQTLVLPAVIVVQEAWTLHVAAEYPEFVPWLTPVILAASVAACAALVYAVLPTPPDARLSRRIGVAGLVAGCVAMFAAPTAWSLSVLDSTYAGSSFDAYAGPPYRPEGGKPGKKSGGPAISSGGQGASGQPGRSSGPSGAQSGGGIVTGLSKDQKRLLAYVQKHNRGAEYTFSTDGWESAAPYIYARALPLLPLGGFTGGANSATLAEYRKLVADGKLRFALLRGGDGKTGASQPGSSVGQINDWVRSTCTKVEPKAYGAQQPGEKGPGEPKGAESPKAPKAPKAPKEAQDRKDPKGRPGPKAPEEQTGSRSSEDQAGAKPSKGKADPEQQDQAGPQGQETLYRCSPGAV